jgi:hypothetical protein
MLQYQVGLSPADAQEVMALVEGKVGLSGGVVPPAAPGESAPRVLVQPGEGLLSAAQAQALEKAFAVSSSVELQGESGWKSRKLWVAVATLVGMLVQVPLENRLSAQELIAVACVAVAYISWQAMVDIAKVRAKGEPGA